MDRGPRLEEAQEDRLRRSVRQVPHDEHPAGGVGAELGQGLVGKRPGVGQADVHRGAGSRPGR